MHVSTAGDRIIHGTSDPKGKFLNLLVNYKILEPLKNAGRDFFENPNSDIKKEIKNVFNSDFIERFSLFLSEKNVLNSKGDFSFIPHYVSEPNALVFSIQKVSQDIIDCCPEISQLKDKEFHFIDNPDAEVYEECLASYPSVAFSFGGVQYIAEADYY